MANIYDFIDKLPPHVIIAGLVITLLITVICYRGLNR